MSQPELMGIGDLAAASGVPVSALRYYDQRGLLAPAGREGGQRRYRRDALARLSVIQLCKAAGFTLDEIVTLYADRQPGRPTSRALATAKLAQLDEQFRTLETARAILVLGLRCQCDSLDDCRCDVHRELFALGCA